MFLPLGLNGFYMQPRHILTSLLIRINIEWECNANLSLFDQWALKVPVQAFGKMKVI